MKNKCFPDLDFAGLLLFGFEFTDNNIGLLVQKPTGEFFCVEISSVKHFNLSSGANGVNIYVEEGTPNKYIIEDESGQVFLEAIADKIEINGQL